MNIKQNKIYHSNSKMSMQSDTERIRLKEVSSQANFSDISEVSEQLGDSDEPADVSEEIVE